MSGFIDSCGTYFSEEGCIECDWGEHPCHCGEAEVARENQPPKEKTNGE